jgi:hypothetical protein
MIGILAGLGIFTPFATDSNCKNDTSNGTINEKILTEDNFWKDNYVFIPAIVLTIIFIVFTTLLLIFVNEDIGKKFFYGLLISTSKHTSCDVKQ